MNKKIILGATIAISGLWGFAFILKGATFLDWYFLPTVLTQITSICFGAFLIFNEVTK